MNHCQILFRRQTILGLVAALGLLLLSNGCKKDDDDNVTPPPASDLASSYDASVATQWFNKTYDLVKGDSLSPPVASRTYAYAGVALYESIVWGMPDYVSLAGIVNGLDNVPQPTPNAQYHWPSVANAAIAQTLRGLVRPWTVAAVTSFEDELGAQYAASLPPGVYDRSVEYGYLVGVTILNWAAEDGYATLNNCPYTPPTGDGLWVPTPPGNLPPLQPCWGQLRAFTLNNNDECLPVAHATYSTDTSSAFYHQAAECFNAAPNCTPDDSATVYFWADGPIATGTPGGHSIKILTQVLTRDHHNLETAAEAYARVSMAVADAFISCWRAKYIHNLLRPITYIRSEIGPNWNCMITTPNFPEYTSGHSVQSGAAAQVLTSMFGAGYSFVDSTHYPTWTPRSFSSFDDFANEAAMSRLFGGIHYRDAIVFGLDQGECVGVRVAALPLRPNS